MHDSNLTWICLILNQAPHKVVGAGLDIVWSKTKTCLPLIWICLQILLRKLKAWHLIFGLCKPCSKQSLNPPFMPKARKQIHHKPLWRGNSCPRSCCAISLLHVCTVRTDTRAPGQATGCGGTSFSLPWSPSPGKLWVISRQRGGNNFV